MRYTIYQLHFPNGVHFGDGSLDSSMPVFLADTLFSALYIEALKMGDAVAEDFLRKVTNGKIVFSDAFPYMGNTLYLPKPMKRIINKNTNGDSTIKKAFKKLSYIPMDKMQLFLDGKLDAQKEVDQFHDFGTSEMRTYASITGQEETLPYHVGVYYYNEGNGLYFIVGTETDEEAALFFDLFDALSFTGIGGKRSAGLGKFSFDDEEIDEKYFSAGKESGMSLSVSLPRDEELDMAMQDATYAVIKRSGFVYSENHADQQRKKNDFYAFSSGSCFSHIYEGDVFRVSDDGKHPVYRYAKPLFWKLEKEGNHE